MIDNANEWIKLRRSEEREDYWRSANEEVPLSVWKEIYEVAPDLRDFIAYNKTSPHEMLEILAKDDDSRVRYAAAARADARPELLRQLALDADEAVRGRICWNPSTPRDVLELLVATEWFEPNLERLRERLAELDSQDGS